MKPPPAPFGHLDDKVGSWLLQILEIMYLKARTESSTTEAGTILTQRSKQATRE